MLSIVPRGPRTNGAHADTVCHSPMVRDRMNRDLGRGTPVSFDLLVAFHGPLVVLNCPPQGHCSRISGQRS